MTSILAELSDAQWDAILSVVASLAVIIAGFVRVKYAKLWRALKVVTTIIELADRENYPLEDKASVIKNKIADVLPASSSEGQLVHKAAKIAERSADALVLEMKPVK